MYTDKATFYEIFNHEEGTITVFEDYDNFLRWVEDNKNNPNGYDEYGLKLVLSSETTIGYWDKQNDPT